MKSAHTSHEWIEIAKKKHGDVYDYSKVEYVNALTKVEILCDIHGPFWQIPRKHLRGSKCPQCSRSQANDHKKFTVDRFVEECDKVHGNKYDYGKVILPNLNAVVTIVCSTHGEFKQRAYSHLKGHGCKKCMTGVAKGRGNHIYDTEWFVRRAKEKHGDNFCYDISEYLDSTSRITITCREHGSFSQVARDHLNGHGCPKCVSRTLSDRNRKTISEFISEAIKIHSAKFDYSCVDYVNQATPVTIICPIHGEFQQSPKHHLRGQGCPKCHISNGHLSLCAFLDSHHIDYVVNDRSVIDPLEIDIFIPSRMVGIEYHGVYWHSFDHPESTSERLRHWRKAEAAIDSNIMLMQIFEHEYQKSRGIVESMIKNRLGLSNRIYARSLRICELSNGEVQGFYDSSHLAGHKPSTMHLGLVNDDKIFACMSFTKTGMGYELSRYACALDYVVVGGPSRLFKRFVSQVAPRFVLSYADRRFSAGGMYNVLGFVLERITRPNYRYVMGSSVYSRQQFQKHKLHTKLEVFDAERSESENMFHNGYRRLWDAGHFRFMWKPS